MRNIVILSAIAVLCACNQQPSSQESSTETTAATETNTSKPAEEVPTEAINNPSTASDPTAQPGEFPVMTFKNDYYDFGDIVEGQVVETTYEFTNTGKADLLINRCDATCGCTVPNWPKEPIKPGKSGKIKIEFNSSGKSGINNKIVTVVSNTKEGKAELKFRANVQAIKKTE
jgi:hypothetical protein